jgi:hypothetical protein
MNKMSRIVPVMAVLAAILWSTASRAEDNSCVLALYSEGSSSTRLLCISAGGIREIGQLRYQAWYGSDEDSAAFVQVDGQKGSGIRALVVDLKTMSVVMDKTFGDLHAWPKKSELVENLAVRSKDSTFYFLSTVPTNTFGYAEVNWKTGEAHPVPSSPADEGIYASLVVTPPGFASVMRGRDIVLYGANSRQQLSGIGRASRQVYHVPTIGLMELIDGTNRQITDSNLAPISGNTLQFAGSAVRTTIFVRSNGGKPLLIWGENTGPDDPAARSGTINKIVIFDPIAKMTILEKQLATAFADFRPNADGSKIYLVETASRKIFSFDRKMESLTVFSQFPEQNGPFVIVAAN